VCDLHLVAAVVLLAGCATLAWREEPLEARVAAVLERRGLGPDALRVVDNLLRHGAPPPPAAPPIVLELLARPLATADAAAIFRSAVPSALMSLDTTASSEPFDELLRAYLRDLAEAQRLLRAATPAFDDEALLRELAQGLPSSARLSPLRDAQVERASRLLIEATARFAARVRDVPLEPQRFDSPIGTVVIGTRGSDRHGPEAALIVDPGGNDVYERRPARGGAVSVIVDLAGNDQYRGTDVAIRALSAIVDLAGDDRYAMQGSGLGAAIAGVSLVIDYAGNDAYEAGYFAQGAAAFGVGALVDLDGDDRYRIEAWGQGFGMALGTGLLWDRRGNDRYAAGGVPDPFERGAGLSGAQGAAFGARGRLGGGTGILRDDEGDDRYQAQMFAQGSGYYYGLGILWDRGGSDRYEAHRYAQGNAAHQAVGVLRDESGDDRYRADWYAQGMGLDIAVGVLVDPAGRDTFSARGGSQGAASANGFGLLWGSASARLFVQAPEHAWGRAEWLRGLPSVGVLLPAPPDDPPVAVQPATPLTCPSADPGEALACRVLNAPDAQAAWRLASRESCNVRALALRAWPTLAAAHEGIRSDCFRLQAAAAAAFARLGAPPPRDAALPSFLRSIPPQEDTF
jgi:hypothetical protein